MNPKPTTHPQRVVDFVLRHAQDAEPCILCNSPTHNRGLFFPGNSQEYGAPQGKTRTIVYPMCLRHPRNEKTATEIEQILLREFGDPMAAE